MKSPRLVAELRSRESEAPLFASSDTRHSFVVHRPRESVWMCTSACAQVPVCVYIWLQAPLSFLGTPLTFLNTNSCFFIYASICTDEPSSPKHKVRTG